MLDLYGKEPFFNKIFFLLFSMFRVFRGKLYKTLLLKQTKKPSFFEIRKIVFYQTFFTNENNLKFKINQFEEQDLKVYEIFLTL